MTHAEFFADRPHRVDVPSCGGDLRTVWVRSDPSFGTGPPGEHVIARLECDGCLAQIIHDRTADVVLNVLRREPATRLARELALACEPPTDAGQGGATS